jgi:hypothetical protein
MSIKTAQILDHTHKLIVDKQLEMKKKHRVAMKISDIIDILVTENIHMLEKYMGINAEKEKLVNTDNGECDTKKHISSITSPVDNMSMSQKKG